MFSMDRFVEFFFSIICQNENDYIKLSFYIFLVKIGLWKIKYYYSFFNQLKVNKLINYYEDIAISLFLHHKMY